MGLKSAAQGVQVGAGLLTLQAWWWSGEQHLGAQSGEL